MPSGHYDRRSNFGPMTHGLSNTPEYFAWNDMIRRCTDPHHPEWKRYGGRGITVDKGWLGVDGLQKFYIDVGPRPGYGYVLDRIRNNENYEPGNVRWITAKESARNRRDNRLLTLNEEVHCIAEWTEILNFDPPDTLYSRVKRGWSDERALTTPVIRRAKKSKIERGSE